MLSFFKRRTSSSEPAKTEWVSPPPREGVLQPGSQLFDTPATLLEIARMFHGRKQFPEAENLARTAALFLLRMHYMVAGQKQNTTLDTPALLPKLQRAGLLTEWQVQHANELREEIDTLSMGKRSRKAMQLGNYLVEILATPAKTQSPIKDDQVDRAASPWKDWIRVEGRKDGHVEVLGTFPSYTEAAYYANMYQKDYPETTFDICCRPKQ